MPVRKHHSKSRFGCTTCKRRHVKCGEELPACDNCVSRRLNCTYTSSPTAGTPTSSQARHTNETHPALCGEQDGTPTTPQPSQVANAPDPSGSNPSRLQELQLMLHYITTTYETMLYGSADMHIWKSTIPAEAVKHEFLADALLALSALHFASQNPDSKWTYTQIALRYQSSGMRKFTSALSGITDSNCHALFACSIIIAILEFAFPGPTSQKSLSTYTERLFSISRLLRGIGAIVHKTEESIKRGELGALFQESYPKLVEHANRQDVVEAMLKLCEQADKVGKYVDPGRSQIYKSSIEQLENAFEHVAIYQHVGGIIAWLAQISPKLLDLLKEGDPMAQLIFTHYGVLLSEIHDRWWGRGFGVGLVETLAEALHTVGPEWASSTVWAIGAVAFKN